MLNAVVSAMRVAFARYSPKIGEVIQNARVERLRKNKDGSTAKKPEVWHMCAQCKELCKTYDIDHREPVVEIGKTYRDYTFDEYFQRLNCDISNLQLLCTKCHDEKTIIEKNLRQEEKKKCL